MTVDDGIDSAMTVAAIVVTFEAPDRLDQCLRSIVEQTKPPDVVVVVNNGSPAAAQRVVDFVRDANPAVAFDFVQSPYNSGPAGGHFIGMRRALEAGYDFFWVMDDDIVAEQNCLSALLSECRMSDELLIVWPEQSIADGSVQNYPGWYGFLLSRAAVEAAGLPNRDLVWWIEDTEYLYQRLPSHGVRSERASAARVMHGDGRPEGQKPPWKIFYETRNVLWYRIRVQRLRFPGRLIRAMGSLFKSAARSSQRSAASRALVAGVVEGLRGGLGQRWPLPVQRLDETPMVPSGSRLNAFVMTYHREDRLVEHVEALMTQSVAPDRIIVVDNGNSSALAPMLTKFGDRVEIVTMPWNAGPAGAAAVGLRTLLGTSEWIYWGDDDQPPAPGAFEALLDIADREQAAAVASRGWLWSSRTGALRRAQPSSPSATTMNLDTTAGSMSLLIRSRSVQAIGLPVPEMFWGFEDIEYLLRLRERNLRLVAPPRPTNAQAGTSRAAPLEYPALPRTYYSVRNSIYMVVYCYKRPISGLIVSARAIVSAARCAAKRPRYLARVLRLTLRGIADGWLGLLGEPMPLKSSDLRRDLLVPGVDHG